MSMTKLVAAAAVVLMISAGAVSAQSAAPAPAPAAQTPAAAPQAPAKAATPAIKPKAERTPESLKCSAEADKQNLHGAPRKAFRKKCLDDAKKAAKATKS